MRFLVLGLGWLLAFSVNGAVNVKNIRMWPAPDHTRIVLDIDRPVKYNLFSLSDPDRVVIDLRDARFLKQAPSARSSDRFLAGIRTGVRKGVNLRVVLDLKQPVRPRSFLLKPNRKYGHRLVIDIYVKAAPAGASTSTGTAAVRKPVKRSTPAARRDAIIAIDPGHGGEDPGTVTRSKILEKDIVFAIARALAHRVDRTQGMKAVLTRDGDYYVGLRRRTEIARSHGADLFVSIHADAFRDKRVSGSAVYVLSNRGASSEIAQVLANRENASDLVGGVSLADKEGSVAYVLVDLQQNYTLAANYELGKQVLKFLGQVGRTHKRGLEKAGFLVLKSPDIPSILVEAGFLTNPSDARRLSNPGHQGAIAQAILDGIHAYFDRNPPPGVVLAAVRRHIIARGETLSGIAARYQVSVKRLRAANKIDGSVIQAGKMLHIPRRN